MWLHGFMAADSALHLYDAGRESEHPHQQAKGKSGLISLGMQGNPQWRRRAGKHFQSDCSHQEMINVI